MIYELIKYPHYEFYRWCLQSNTPAIEAMRDFVSPIQGASRILIKEMKEESGKRVTTLTENIYDKNGLLLNQVIDIPNKNRILLNYHYENQLINRIERNGKLVEKYEYIDKKLIKIFRPDASPFMMTECWDYTDNSLVHQNDSHTHIYEFRADGQTHKTSHISQESKHDELYFYDNLDRLIKIESYEHINGILQKEGLQIELNYKEGYDDFKEKRFYPDSDEYEEIRFCRENNKLKEQKISLDGNVCEEEVFELNGNQISQIFYESGVAVTNLKIDYDYDQFGNWIRKKEKYLGSSPTIIEREIKY